MGLGTPTSRVQKVSDFVRSIHGRMRSWSLTTEERDLVPHLRGRADLCDAIKNLILSRIRAREDSPLPPDPVDCKATMAIDKELRWLIKKIDFLRDAPLNAQENDEQTR